MKVERFSALRTSRFYPQRDIPGTRFSLKLRRSQGLSATSSIKSMNISLAPSGIEPATFRLLEQCDLAWGDDQRFEAFAVLGHFFLP